MGGRVWFGMLIIELSRLVFKESKITNSCVVCSKVDRLLPCYRVRSSMNMLGSVNNLGKYPIIVVARYDGVTVLSSKSQCVLRDSRYVHHNRGTRGSGGIRTCAVIDRRAHETPVGIYRDLGHALSVQWIRLYHRQASSLLVLRPFLFLDCCGGCSVAGVAV